MTFFGHVEERFGKKAKVISKFMTSQHRKQTIAINKFPNTSRSTDNQTMKSGQLTYNVEAKRLVSFQTPLPFEKLYMR